MPVTLTHTFGLEVTAERLGLLLLLELSGLRCRCGGFPRSAAEEHARQAMTNRRPDSDGTGGRSHLSEHAGTLRLSNSWWWLGIGSLSVSWWSSHCVGTAALGGRRSRARRGCSSGTTTGLTLSGD